MNEHNEQSTKTTSQNTSANIVVIFYKHVNTMNAGKPHVIKCEVMDPVSGGVFVWTAGGQTLKNTNRSQG